MKYTIVLFMLLVYLFSFQSTSFAAGTSSSSDPSVYDAIQKGEKKSTTSSTTTTVADSQSPSLFPLFMKFIASFVLVLGLLIVLLRYLSKKGRPFQSNGPVLPLGGQALGNNRSLQIVLIGQTIYVIGVGETITLIRTISQGEEYQHLLESYENQPEGLTPNWLTKDPKKLWNSVFQKHMKKMQRENGEE